MSKPLTAMGRDELLRELRVMTARHQTAAECRKEAEAERDRLAAESAACRSALRTLRPEWEGAEVLEPRTRLMLADHAAMEHLQTSMELRKTWAVDGRDIARPGGVERWCELAQGCARIRAEVSGE